MYGDIHKIKSSNLYYVYIYMYIYTMRTKPTKI